MKHAMGRNLRTHAGKRRGAAVVEFVFVAALLVFLLFGIMEVGFMLSNSLTVSSAAQQGARAAALGGDAHAVETAVGNAAQTLRKPREFSMTDGNTVAEYAQEGSDNWKPWNPNTPPPDTTKDQVRITVKYEYKYLTGDLLGGIGNLLSGTQGQPTDHRTLVGVAVMRYGG